MQQEHEYDVVWIGTGQATLSVLPKLVAAGKSVAVVESGNFGGTCVNNGCTPTKTLVASAHAIHTARRGSDFGFSTTEVDVDFDAVMRAQINVRSNGSTHIEHRLQELTDGSVYKGTARFLSPTCVQVGESTICGKTVVIHTGTRPNAPSIDGIAEVPYLTNESILDLTELPAHLAIVGGGYIALEFGQIFKRLGSDVTILEASERLLPREDPDIAAAVEQALTDEGIQIKTNCMVSRVSGNDDIRVDFAQSGSTDFVNASHLLVAVGRSPNSSDLDLANAAIETDERGYIRVDNDLRTTVSNVFALGDVNGRGAFTHTSVNDGQRFWERYQEQEGLPENKYVGHVPTDQRQVIYSMFIDPPLARVGMSETEAVERVKHVLVATMPMAQIARAREKRETIGLVKIVVDADSEQILGATIFGTSGDEVIGLIAAYMQQGVSYKELQKLVLPHPTVSELIPWVLNDLRPVA